MRVCLCSVAKNPETQATVLGDAPGLVERLLVFVNTAVAAVRVPVDVTGLLGADADAVGGGGGGSSSAVSSIAFSTLGDGAVVTDGGDVSSVSTVHTLASGAMWALCGLVMANPQVQAQVAAMSGAIEDLKTLMTTSAAPEEVQSAAAWVVCQLAVGVGGQQQRLVEEYKVVDALVTLMRNGAPSSAGLAAWAVRSLVFEHPGNQRRVFESPAGVVQALADLLPLDAAPSTQASAVWAIGTLCVNQPGIQSAMGDEVVLVRIVALLESPVAQVQVQAANALYNIAVHNPVNQGRIAGFGGLEKMAALLHSNLGKQTVVEKVLAALLCLIVKHSGNQDRVAGMFVALGDVCGLLASASPRIAGLAAGVVRIVVVERPGVQMRCAAFGAIGHLVAMVGAADGFAQEQGCAALFNVLSHQPFHVRLAHEVSAVDKLVGVVTAGVGGGANPVLPKALTAGRPSPLAKTCSLMCLCNFVDEVDEVRDDLRAVPGFTKLLCVLSAKSNPDVKMRQQADRLLRKLFTATEYGQLGRVAAKVLFATLQSDDAPHCPICVTSGGDGGDAEGGGGGAGAGGGGGAGVFLPCFHHYHRKCILKWVVKSDACPMCTAPVLATIQKLLVSGVVLFGREGYAHGKSTSVVAVLVQAGQHTM